MSLLNISLVGGLLSLPIREGDIVEVSSNHGTFYGKINRLGNNSLTIKSSETSLIEKNDEILYDKYKKNVTLDIDDIYSILQY